MADSEVMTVVVSANLVGKDCPDFLEAAKNLKAQVFLSLSPHWGGVVGLHPWIHWSHRRQPVLMRTAMNQNAQVTLGASPRQSVPVCPVWERPSGT